MADSSTVKSKSLSLELKASLAPAHYFFCRRIALPEELEESEREGAISLELESISPFPLEHLNFGYIIDDAGKYAFVFAAYKRRFESAEISGWSESEFVVPDFSYALVKERENNGPLMIVSERSVAFFRFDSESNLPAFFQALPRENDEDHSSDIESLKKVMDLKPGDGDCRVLISDGSVFEDGGKIRLNATESDSRQTFSTMVERSRFWQLDLRDPEVIENAQGEERRNFILWNSVLGAAAVFLLLLLGELIFGISYGYLSLRKNWNVEQAPFVAHISSQNSTVIQLEQFEESDLMPYEMLEAINPYKPVSVQYSKISTDGPERLVIDANARSVSDANQFKTSLERFPKIDNVLLENMRPLPGGATFRAILTFQFGAFEKADEELTIDSEVAVNG